MRSALDEAIDATLSAMMAPGGPAETVAATLPSRVVVRQFANAPPTLNAYYAATCHQHRAAEFLVDGDVRLTFGEVHAAAVALARGLAGGHGVGKGDRVAIAARNSANWVVAFMAVTLAGGVAVLVNGFGTGADMAEGIRMTGCSHVIADAARIDRLHGHDLGGAHLMPVTAAVHPRQGLAVLLERGGAGTSLPDVAPDDPATILFTSGSTGSAKGACSTHRAVVQATMIYAVGSALIKRLMEAQGLAFDAQPATLMNVPLFHVTGAVTVMLQSFAQGRRLVMMPRWDALEAMRLIEAERVTYFTGVPLMSHEIMTHAERHRFDLSSCRVMAGGGAPRPLEHVRRIADAMAGTGAPALGYGLTETNAVGAMNFASNYLAKPASTGPAIPPLVELSIVDAAGDPLPQGEVGEVAIRTVALFDAYWNDAAATRDAFPRPGLFVTGDIGYLDADGYLFLVDRKKDIVIRGGENITCAEIEDAAYAHPLIAEASAFALPDARLGEVPALVFHERAEAALTAEELADFLRSRLAAFKVPVHIWRHGGALPRLGTQKIDRVALRDRYGANPPAGH